MSKKPEQSTLAHLKEMSCHLRKDVLRMIHFAGDGHPGPTLSITDIVTALFFEIMRIDPLRPDWAQRDRFILSKGHACPVLYSALIRRNFLAGECFPTLRCLGSPLQGHPCMKKTRGIDMTTGSLGHGISIGAGMAAAGRLSGEDYHVYVIVGDGELNEGIVWEAALAASHHHLNHLIVYVDYNGFQSGGRLEDVSGLASIDAKFAAFGWHVQNIDGHDFSEILEATSQAQETEQPSVIVAHTIKGKGIPFMEGDNSWHKRVPTKDELAEALKVLRDCS
jgi:transketolase